jgi:hypothetical protein
MFLDWILDGTGSELFQKRNRIRIHNTAGNSFLRIHIQEEVCFIYRDTAPYRITGITCLVGDVEWGFIVESGDNREDGVQAGEGATHYHHLDRLSIHVRYRRNGTHRAGFNFKVKLKIFRDVVCINIS